MKNITKNLMLGLAGVCTIAVIWFVIELIVVNRNVEPRDPGSVVAAGTPDADAAAPDDDELQGDADDPFGMPSEEETPRPPPRGQHYELPIDPDSNTILNVYAQLDLFEFVQRDEDWMFDYRGGGNAALTIGFYFLTPQGAAVDAEKFLNDKLGEEDLAEFRGTSPILETDLLGFAVSAQQGGVTYEAWLYVPPGSELALAFLIYYEFNDQRDALYEVINSMSISDAPASQGGDTGTDADTGTDTDANTNNTEEGTEEDNGNGTEG